MVYTYDVRLLARDIVENNLISILKRHQSCLFAITVEQLQAKTTGIRNVNLIYSLRPALLFYDLRMSTCLVIAVFLPGN